MPNNPTTSSRETEGAAKRSPSPITTPASQKTLRRRVRRKYRSVVEQRRIRFSRKPRKKAPASPEKGKQQFLRFMAASASCSTLDQLLAWLLFSALRRPLAQMGFVRILVSNVLARCVSLSLNYALNHRLVFSLDVDDPEYQRNARRESLPRFLALSAAVLALSTLGVYLAHTFLGVAEWKAKIVIDIALFFLNYNVQRVWVFRSEVTVKPKATTRSKGSSR